MLERANYAFKATAPARFWPAVPRFAAAAGFEVGGSKKVAKSSGVVGGGCVCRKVALGSRCSRCGPTGLAGAFAHRAAGAVDRAAGCERWMPTGCNKYAPQKTAGLPGTELRKRADRQQWDEKSQQSFAPSE